MFFRFLITLATLLSFSMSAQAEVSVSRIFSSEMMLQRDKPVTVWGKADSGEKITVTIAAQQHSTQEVDGKWQVTLKPLKVGGPHTLEISASNKISFENILVGDIWLCGGQSNMDYDINSYVNWKGEIGQKYNAIVNKSAEYSQVRIAKMEKVSSLPNEYNVPLVEDEIFQGKWQTPRKEVALVSSAVGFVFATKLHDHLQIPIALIDANKGGRFIWLWEPPRARKERGETRPNRNMYNAMIGSYANKFPIKGFIWYQGESDAIDLKHAQAYEKNFKAMIEGWRYEFNDPDMPFLFVQLASYERNPYQHGITYPVLRDAQTAALDLKNTGMAVAIDLGDVSNIHPPQKIEVSERLVLAARKIAYDEDIIFSGPLYENHKIKNGSIVVNFQHCANGLKAKAVTLNDKKLSSEKVFGFEIAGADQKYYPATAIIAGNSATVSSPQVTAPVAVRYAYHGFPYANLYNSADFPCSPFRTDDFEISFSSEDANLYSRVLFLPKSLQSKKMTLAEKREVAKIYDHYITPEIEKQRRSLWNALVKARSATKDRSAAIIRTRKNYDDLLQPLQKKIEADVKATGIFQN